MSDDDGDAPRLLAEVRTLLDEVRDALLDTASGEVVGALWDEFRTARESLDRLVASTDAVDRIADVQADVAALRSELSEGLVVEPSDALAGTVDKLRTDVAGLDQQIATLADRLAAGPPATAEPEVTRPDGTLTAVAADVTALRDDLARIEERLGADDELRSLRTGIDDIIGRLDEGLVLAEEVAPPADAAAPEVAVADQVATLRDLVTTEFDALRQLVDRQAPESDEEPAAATGPVEASLDDATIDRLREEIRAAMPAPDDIAAAVRTDVQGAGGASDELVDALRKELVALRRRIRLRAEGEIFSAEQLDAIADAVAARLAQ